MNKLTELNVFRPLRRKVTRKLCFWYCWTRFVRLKSIGVLSLLIHSFMDFYSLEFELLLALISCYRWSNEERRWVTRDHLESLLVSDQLKYRFCSGLLWSLVSRRIYDNQLISQSPWNFEAQSLFNMFGPCNCSLSQCQMFNSKGSVMGSESRKALNPMA